MLLSSLKNREEQVYDQINQAFGTDFTSLNYNCYQWGLTSLLIKYEL